LVFAGARKRKRQQLLAASDTPVTKVKARRSTKGEAGGRKPQGKRRAW
jgi:hypothetical protein